MAERSTTDQAEFLVSRTVAEQRREGTMSPDAEAIALFESIAINLLLHPRASLLFAMLAKNGLQKIIQDELDVIEEVRSSVLDLNNPTLAVRTTKQLNTARTALLQMEQLNRLTTDSNSFKRFNSSVDEFLNKVVAKGVKSPGATELTRPGVVAIADMGTSFINLLDIHDDFLDRLYALSVGVDNFLTSPLSTIVGLTTASRARSDVEEIITTIETTGSIDASTDLVIRMLTNRAAIRTIGDLPKVTDPVLDSVNFLPTGYTVKGVSDPAVAVKQSSVGPFALPTSAQVSVSVSTLTGSTSVPLFNVPQNGFHLNNKAAIASVTATYPITIPVGTYLFIRLVDSTYTTETSFKLGPFTPGVTSLATLITAINTFSAGIPPLSGKLHAAEFIIAGTNRLLIYHDDASLLRISTSHAGLTVDPNGGGTATLYDGTVYTKSITSLVGFTGIETGIAGTTPVQFVIDCLANRAGSVTTTVRNDGDRFSITTLSSSPGTALTITAPSVLGIAGTVLAVSDTFRLYGTVNSETLDPVNPIGIVDIADSVIAPTGNSGIIGLTPTRIKLSSSLSTFDGNLTISSALTNAYQGLFVSFTDFVTTWVTGPFASNLDSLNLSIGSLGNGSPQGQRQTVLSLLDSLESSLTSLLTIVQSAVLPDTAAQGERAVVSGILDSLTERKYDKAIDLFLKCRIQEALDSTMDTASFGGSLLKATSDFGREDLILPNRTLDEGLETTNKQPIKGL